MLTWNLICWYQSFQEIFVYIYFKGKKEFFDCMSVSLWKKKKKGHYIILDFPKHWSILIAISSILLTWVRVHIQSLHKRNGPFGCSVSRIHNRQKTANSSTAPWKRGRCRMSHVCGTSWKTFIQQIQISRSTSTSPKFRFAVYHRHTFPKDSFNP